MARLWATRLDTRVRRAIEDEVVRADHGARLDHGVTGYGLGHCRADVRVALPWHLATPLASRVTGITGVTDVTDVTDVTGVMGVQRHGHRRPARLPIVARRLPAIDDWDA
ncbi:hypothetical protein [Streptomyces sp. NPDC057702]|uniref:hypothetical protein n=1 Tax=unclassified Streptomyces TaxID=2593676 RepID=UPI00367FDA86